MDSHRLALFCGSGDEQVRCLGQIKDHGFVPECLSDGHREFRLAVPECVITEDRTHTHHRSAAIGDLIFRHFVFGNIFIKQIQRGQLVVSKSVFFFHIIKY